MVTESTPRGISGTNLEPCSGCPWRTSNLGKPHPGKWYDASNLRRLWRGLKTGDSMSCHMTDANVPLPDGWTPDYKVVEGKLARECAGGAIIQQREVARFQEICELRTALGKRDALKVYRETFPKGMSRAGLIEIATRMMWGTNMVGANKLPALNLNEEVGHPDLPAWGSTVIDTSAMARK